MDRRRGGRAGRTPCFERLSGQEARIGAVLSAGEQQLVALAQVHLSPVTCHLLESSSPMRAPCRLDPIAKAQAKEAFRERGAP